MYDKSITYDRGDYKMELDGRYIGHRSTYHQAEVALDQTVFDMMSAGHFATATELDGGAVCITCGNDGDCPDCATPLFDDVARVIDMALGNAPAKDVVPELRRVRARLASV